MHSPQGIKNAGQNVSFKFIHILFMSGMSIKLGDMKYRINKNMFFRVIFLWMKSALDLTHDIRQITSFCALGLFAKWKWK
jgi:hypothetical protein